jgi:flagellar biosynthesis protein FlhG
MTSKYNLHKLTQTEGSGRLITVTSGKGGVGKSMLSLNLAATLAQKGRSVILIDGDLMLPNLHLLAGVQPRRTLAHAILHGTPLAEVLIDGPGGMRMACGGSDLDIRGEDDASMSQLFNGISELKTQSDFVIVDTGAGVNPTVLDFASRADETWVVATAESTSVSDAYALIKILSGLETKPEFRLVVNRVRSESEGRDVFDRLDLVIRRFLQVEVGYAGHVIEDSRIRESAEKGRPMILAYPRHRATKCLLHLTDRLS